MASVNLLSKMSNSNHPETNKKTVILPSASDFHIHLRQDDLMNMVVPRIAEGGVSLCYVMVL